MGKAARWFKGLFGMKKGKDGREDFNSNPGSGAGDGDGKKRRSNFGHSGREALPAAGNAWLRSYYTETEKEQNKQAIAVAEATAAAAVSAVAAAQAAVAAVRITRHGRGGGGGERLAAVRIQTVFRGFLARKALRALRGLVKIQALVRGFLVRKQAAATLNGMQAMARAQATVRLQKLRRQIADDRNRARIGARKSLERFDDTRSEYYGSVHSRRLSATLDAVNAVDENPKIVEVDTGRPKSRSRRSNTNTSISDFGDYPFTQTLPSPNPHHRSSSRSPVPDRRSFHETEWFFSGEDCRFSEPQTTPRFSYPPATPTKSVSGDHFSRYGGSPNYMSNTQSFNAKLRSYSAPKQRPETKKRLSLSDMMEARSSLSGVRMQRSCSRAQEAIDFKNVVVNKLDGANDFSRYSERYSVSGNLRTLYR